MAYPTTEELVAASSSAELADLSSAEQDALRDVAISAVERFTGQTFTSPGPGETVIIDGTGGREAFLPKRCEALTSVVVKGTSIDLTDVALDANGARLYFRPRSTDYAIVAMYDTPFDTRTFRAGAGTIMLTGTFGWSLCPDAVRQALRLEMEEQASADASALSGLVSSYRRLGIADIAQGNLRAQIGTPSEIGARAARLLAPFVWTGAGGYLV
jgi:hypothetical protein